MTDEPEFLRRWSRRKRAARNSAEEPDAPDAKEQPVEPEEAPEDRPESEAAKVDVEDLPDIDTLTAESDFTPFMKPGVPTALKNRALRKLWRVNPVFGHLDGLNDYDGDFTDAATVVKDLKTLYKVGRGFLPDPAEQAAEDDPGEPAEADPSVADEAIDRGDDPESGDTGGEDEDSNNIS